MFWFANREVVLEAGADPGFFEGGGDLGAAEAHLRAPFMRAAH